MAGINLEKNLGAPKNAPEILRTQNFFVGPSLCHEMLASSAASRHRERACIGLIRLDSVQM